MATEAVKLQLEHCQREVELHPTSAVAHFNLGLAYSQRGLVDRAERAYRKALDVDPDLIEAWVNLGGALMLKWDFQGVIEANREALKRKEDLLLAHYNTGQAHLYLGEAEGVVRCCSRVVELEPDHAAGHYFLAVGLLAMDRVEDARQTLTRAQALGYSPAPDFLRALGAAEGRTEEEDSTNVVNIGAQAPNDSNRRE